MNASTGQSAQAPSSPRPRAAAAKQTILQGAAIMMFATAASRGLGYVRDKIIAYRFGSTPSTDAYWAAFQVPDLLYYLLAGGALSAALIPVFTGYLARQQEEEAWRMVNILATVLLLAVAVGVALIIIFAPYLVPVAAFGFKRRPEVFEECVLYVRVMAPMVFFTMLSALAGGVLQSFHHFTAPALGWCMYNIGIIAGAVFLASSLGILGLCLGVLAGAAMVVAVQVPALVSRGFRFRPALDLRHPGVRRTAALFLPLMVGLAVQQIALLWLPGFFGSFYPRGVTNLRYANRLIVLPLGLFGVSISSAAFPSLASQFTRGQAAEFKRTLNGALRAVFLFSVPSGALLTVLSGPIITLLWQGGAYDEAAARSAAFALTLWAPGLFAVAAMQVVNRGFYSMQDALTPPLIGVGYVALIVGLSLALMRTPVAYGSIALATSVAAMPALAAACVVLRRKIGPMDGRRVLGSLLRVVAASALMSAAAWMVSDIVGQRLGLSRFEFTLVAPPTQGTGGTVVLWQVGVQVLAGVTAGCAAFLAGLRVLGAEELGLVSDTLRKRLLRGRAAQ